MEVEDEYCRRRSERWKNNNDSRLERSCCYDNNNNNVDAEAAAFDDAVDDDDGFHTALMSNRTGKPARFCPPTISVHDNGNMLGKLAGLRPAIPGLGG